MQAMGNRSNLSVLFVVGLTAGALLLGWALRNSAIGSHRERSVSGVTVALPEQWLVDRSAGAGLANATLADPYKVFSAWDPLDPSTRFSLSLMPSGAENSLAATASIRNLQRAQRLTAYRILEQTPVTLKGRDGYRVSFAFVDASAMDQVPVIFQGVDYFFLDGDQVIVATLETSRELGAALPAFQDFAVSSSAGE